MSEIDDRRDQYVPLDSHIAFKRTGAALLAKWGPDGLLAFILMLAAAKREPVQGTFIFASDSEAWAKIGFTPSGFTIDELLRVLGHRKQTSRRRHGHLSYVKFTQWERWNRTFKRREDAARKSSTRALSDPDIEQTESGQATDKNATEVEVESEGEREEVTAKAVTPKPRKPDPLWDVLDQELGKVETESERGKRNKALKELREIGATPDALRERIAWWRREWSSVTCTANGLAANWSVLAGTPTASAALTSRRNGMSPQEIVDYTKGRP